jgi:chemotaxis protein histidine kinase CheA
MPLLILAGALKAVEAIQQGCELYKEYKGVVLEAKATFDEAKEHVDEVVGLWGFIKEKLFGAESEANKPPNHLISSQNVEADTKTEAPPKKAKKAVESHSEQEIKAELIKNLKVFFKAMIAIQKKIEQQQLRIDTQYIEPDELLDVSLDLVIAKKEMEKAQKEIREVMIYQSPPELGALYTDVIEMFGIVQEKQEVTHLLAVRTRKEEVIRKTKLINKIRQRIAWVVVMALIVLELWGLIIALLLARQPM